MENRNYKVYSHSILSCFLVGLVLVLLNLAFSRTAVRADLTEEGLFSLSPGSKSITSKIVDPVTITVFWGNIPKVVRQERRRFEGILDEVQAHSNGKVSVRWVDADTDDGKNLAEEMGIQKLQVHANEGANQVLQDAYAGLVIESGDREPTRIQSIFGLESFEYTIMADLDGRRRTTPAVVALFDADDPQVKAQATSRAPNASRGRFGLVAQQLAGIFGRAFRPLQSIGERIDPEIDVLIVAAPHVGTINDDIVFALDQFTLRGGRLILLLDPVSLPVAFKQEGEREPNTSGLETWLEHLGITAEYGVVGDFGRRNQGWWGTREGRGAYPFMPLIHSDGLAKDHIVTNSEQLVVPMLLPSSLSVDATKQTEAKRDVKVLLRTSPDGYLRSEVGIVAETLSFPVPDGRDRKRHTLGVLLDGPATSMFAGKPSPAEARAAAAAEAKAAAEAAAVAEAEAGGAPGEAAGSPDGPGAAAGSPDGASGDDTSSEGGVPEGDAPAPAPQPEDPPKEDDAGGDGPEDDAEVPTPTGPPRFDEGTIRVMIFGDADNVADYCLKGGLAAQNGRGGLALLLNASSWFAGSEDLLRVTSQASKKRPLDEMEENERSWIKLLNLLAVPLLLLGIGIVVFLVRRSQGA